MSYSSSNVYEIFNLTTWKSYQHLEASEVKLAHILDGRYLSDSDSNFCDLVHEDISRYWNSFSEFTATNSRLSPLEVLVFPPVTSYHRLLIHKTAEEFPALCSFSISQGDNRRTVICPKAYRIMPDSPEDTSSSFLAQKSSPSVTGSGGRGRQTPEGLTSDTRSRQQESTSAAPPKRAPPRERSSKKARRPDQQLYVPRRARQSNSTSSENPQSGKQTVDAKQPDFKDNQQFGRPVASVAAVGDLSHQTDHTIDARPEKLIADTFPNPKVPSLQDQNNLSSKPRNDTVHDQLVDKDIGHHLPSLCETTFVESEKSGWKGDERTDQSANKCRESSVPSEQITPCGFQTGNSANDIVLERSTEGDSEGVSKKTLSNTPVVEQLEKVVCKVPFTDTQHSRSSSHIQTVTATVQGECYQAVAPQDQLLLPTQEIMAEDVARLEATVVSGSGDDETSRKDSGFVDKVTEEKRQDGNEKDDVKEGGDEGEDEEEDSWDTMFDEEGNSLKEDEIKEITDAVGDVSVSVKKPAHDYYNFSPKDNTDYSKLEHVIEVYDFPADFKTEDLVMSFSGFKNKGFDIKWVDDTHALIIFATAQVAGDALGLQNPMLRTRPLSLASKQSKQKAKATVEFLQPYRPRPETSSVAARRMVSNALGVKSNVSKEQRAAERQKLKEAKERKRDERKQKADMWDGNI